MRDRVRPVGKPSKPRERVRPPRQTIQAEINRLKDREWEHGEKHTARIDELLGHKQEGHTYLDECITRHNHR